MQGEQARGTFATRAAALVPPPSFHCQQEKKGKQGIRRPRAEAELARRGARGFLPTDLELCLFHKTPFLGRDAGTGESGFDRLNEQNTLAWGESDFPFLSLVQ